MTAPRADQPGYEALRSELDQNRVMALWMPLLVLAISSMSLFIALSRLVTAQRGEIGLAKALGYTDGQTLIHYLSFALIIAAGGSILGVGLGLLGARGVAATYTSFLGLPFLENGLYPGVLAIAVGVAVVSCIAAAIVPALNSARLAPAIAMHSDPNQSLAGRTHPARRARSRPADAALVHVPAAAAQHLPSASAQPLHRARNRVRDGAVGGHDLDVRLDRLPDEPHVLAGRALGHRGRLRAAGRPEPRGRGARAAGREPRPAGARDAGQGHARRRRGERLADRDEPRGRLPRLHRRDRRRRRPRRSPPATSCSRRRPPQKLGVGVGQTVMVDPPPDGDPVTVRVGSLSDETLGQPAYVSLETAADITDEPMNRYNALYLSADAGRCRTGSRTRSTTCPAPRASRSRPGSSSASRA